MAEQLWLFWGLQALNDAGTVKERVAIATRRITEPAGPTNTAQAKLLARHNVDDENGVSMAARYAANPPQLVPVTEATGGAASIPPSATRLYLRFQNRSGIEDPEAGVIIFWAWGATVDPAVAFLLLPGASENFNGMGMMRDGVSFVTAAGKVAECVWQDDVAP